MTSWRGANCVQLLFAAPISREAMFLARLQRGWGCGKKPQNGLSIHRGYHKCCQLYFLRLRCFAISVCLKLRGIHHYHHHHRYHFRLELNLLSFLGSHSLEVRLNPWNMGFVRGNILVTTNPLVYDCTTR
jgi:hypothetical protein